MEEQKMTRILLNGCNGKMGQVISRLALDFDGVKIVSGVDINDSIDNPYPVFKSIRAAAFSGEAEEIGEVSKAGVNGDIPEFDVIIDFSNPVSFEPLMKYCAETSKPIVLATTGLADGQKAEMQEYSKKVPLFFSSNMSLGINLLIELAKKATRLLEGNFDIEIIEKHHNQKLDAPSGTAIAIADGINEELSEKYNYVYDRSQKREKRTSNEIGIHAIRGGTIVGEHTVLFAGQDEIIELKHTANSKEVFGIGALKAAMFMNGKSPGLYNMKDLIDTI
jgi:4-hydroxy-tetrahydrodipicolinate reductase